VVDPVVAVKTLLLRQAMPDVPLRPGASVVARVASRAEAHGVLVLAGVPLTAQLPEEAKAGATLRLRVTEVTPERVTLQLDGPPVLPPGAEPPPPVPPRDAAPRVAVQDPPRRSREGGEDRASVVLGFQSEALGRLDLRIELTGGKVEVVVDTPVAVHEIVQDQADRLRAGLEARVERSAAVTVRPRHEPVDVYA
jgi:hypothetical protein